MKLKLINFGNARAFSLMEMMVTITIVGILLSLLIPALGLVKKTAGMVKQKSQFSTIETGLEAFKMDFGEYPESMENSEKDSLLTPYSGANKLAEAMVGQDGFGFHQNSQFLANGRDVAGNPLYWKAIESAGVDVATKKAESLTKRRGPYLEIDTANATKLKDIYSSYTDVFGGAALVLADTFGKVTLVNPTTGKKISKRTGMPILYYRANTSNIGHTYIPPSVLGSTDPYDVYIYPYLDNSKIVDLGVPFDSSLKHGFTTDGWEKFYLMTRNDSFTVRDTPYRPESFILHSAGYDGLYGTEDDVFNFDRDK